MKTFLTTPSQPDSENPPYDYVRTLTAPDQTAANSQNVLNSTKLRKQVSQLPSAMSYILKQ